MISENSTILGKGVSGAMMMSSRTADAARCLVNALEHDPFYQSIMVDFAENSQLRQKQLQAYFLYSIEEGQRLGMAHFPEANSGASVWIKPQNSVENAQSYELKLAFLAGVLGSNGLAN